MKTRRWLLHLAVAALGVVPLIDVKDTAAGATPSRGVTGQGAGVLLLPPFTGDRVVLVLDARRFDITHFDKAGAEFSHLVGTVECVRVHGTMAFVSGIVDEGHAPEVAGDPVGKQFAISIADQGPNDLIGVAPPSAMGVPCSPVPLNTVIDEGGFIVND